MNDTIDKLNELRIDLNAGFQTYRNPTGLYYTLRDLYNKGKLTTWEMNAADRVFEGFIANERCKNTDRS